MDARAVFQKKMKLTQADMVKLFAEDDVALEVSFRVLPIDPEDVLFSGQRHAGHQGGEKEASQGVVCSRGCRKVHGDDGVVTTNGRQVSGVCGDGSLAG